MRAEEGTHGDRGDDTRDHDGAERADREGAENFLEREERAGERRVESGGNSRRGAAPNENFQATRLEAHGAAGDRPDGGAEHRGRSLAPGRTAAGERDHGRERANHNRAKAHDAAALRDRELHVGHLLSVGNLRPAHDRPRHPERERGDERPIEGSGCRNEVLADSRHEQRVREIDEPIECHDAERTRGADDEREQHELRALIPVALLDPRDDLRPGRADSRRDAGGSLARNPRGDGAQYGSFSDSSSSLRSLR